MLRRIHLLWLTVPLAAWLGYRAAPLPGAPPRLAAEAAPAPPPLPLPPAVAAIDAGLENAKPAELGRRYLQAAAIPDPVQRDHAIQFVCARWAETDPAAGLAFLATLPGNATQARRALLTEWALIDSDAAWGYLDSLGAGGNDDKTSVTSLLLHEDPDAFFQWYRRQPGFYFSSPGDPAWIAVARVNFGELEAIASKQLAAAPPLPPQGFDVAGNNLYGVLAAVLAEKDPKGAFEWAESLPERVRLGALNGALAALAKTDAVAAVAQFARLSHDKPKLAERLAMLDSHDLGSHVLEIIGRQDPGLVLDLVAKNARLDTDSCLSGLYADAVAKGRIDALDAYRSLAAADCPSGSAALSGMWGNLSSSQLEEVGGRIAAEPDSKARLSALQGIFDPLFKRDPNAAVALAGRLPDAVQRQTLYAGLLWDGSHDRTVSPGRLVEILNQIPASDRAAALAASLTRTSDWILTDTTTSNTNIPHLDPEPEKLATALDNLPPSADLTRAVSAVALAWGQTDPPAAMNWLAALPDPDARNAGLGSALRAWALHDSYGASTWLSAQPAGKLRDTASLSLIEQLKTTEPASAWKWASAISDGALRQTTCSDTFSTWAQNDPAAAAEALDAAAGTLPAAQINELRKSLPAL